MDSKLLSYNEPMPKPINLFQCESCIKTFSEKKYLTKHIKYIQFRKESVLCNFCLKTYRRKDNLLRHLREIHEIKREFECKKCDGIFSEKKNFQNHLESKHVIEYFPLKNFKF